MPNGRNRGHGREVSSPVSQIVREIHQLQSLSALEAEKMVDIAEQMGDYLANQIRLKTSQIRKFLDAVNEIKSKSILQAPNNDRFYRTECMLLKPKLAYAAGHQPEEVK